MTTYYPPDDTLGQTVMDLVRGSEELWNRAIALDRELADERESHRAEVMRLVERAEDAEAERDKLESAALELRDRFRDAEDRATIVDERLAEEGRRVAEAEREVERLTGVDQGLADAQDRIAELEQRLEDSRALAARWAEDYRELKHATGA